MDDQRRDKHDEVREDRWPKALRKAVNWCIGRLNRELRVIYDDNISAPQVHDTPDKVVVAIPRTSGGGAVLYPDFSLSDATNPIDGKRVKVLNGTIGNVLPTGMTLGGTPAFIAPVSGSGHIYLAVQASWVGGVGGSTVISEVTVNAGASIPSDSPASGGSSGTYYFSLGDYNATGLSVAIGAGITGRGSRQFKLCRDWASPGPTYSADWEEGI